MANGKDIVSVEVQEHHTPCGSYYEATATTRDGSVGAATSSDVTIPFIGNVHEASKSEAIEKAVQDAKKP